MPRLAILAIVIGVAVGIVGGLLAKEVWIDVGSGIAAAGVVALYCLALWKNPHETLKAQADVEATAEGYPPPTAGSPPPSSGTPSAQIVQRPVASNVNGTLTKGKT